MINTNKTFNDKPISYEILTNGYNIYLDENLWISQVGQFGKPIDESKTYEENCLAQIDEITTVVEPKPYTQEQYDAVVESLVKEGRL